MMHYCIACQSIFAACYPAAWPNRLGEERRPAIQQWMRAVMAETGWSARQWASKAVTTPTNITRFIAGNSAPMPTWKTMAKLAKVSPIPPPTVDPAHAGNAADELGRELLGILKKVRPDKKRDFVELSRLSASLISDESALPEAEPPSTQPAAPATADRRKGGQ